SSTSLTVFVFDGHRGSRFNEEGRRVTPLEQVQRVVGDFLLADLEVQVASRGVATAPDRTDDGAGLDFVPYLHQILEVMGVEGRKTVRVPELDQVTIETLPPAQDHRTASRGSDGCPLLRLDVDAGVPPPVAAAEPGRDGPVDRPLELSQILSEVGHRDEEPR